MLPLVNEYSLFLVGLVVIALVLLLTGKRFGLKWGLTGMVIVVVALAAFQFITSTPSEPASGGSIAEGGKGGGVS